MLAAYLDAGAQMVMQGDQQKIDADLRGLRVETQTNVSRRSASRVRFGLAILQNDSQLQADFSTRKWTDVRFICKHLVLCLMHADSRTPSKAFFIQCLPASQVSDLRLMCTQMRYGNLAA